jgi:hypothetical protein
LAVFRQPAWADSLNQNASQQLDTLIESFEHELLRDADLRAKKRARKELGKKICELSTESAGSRRAQWTG